jgi:hypothetical protein
VEYPTEDWFGTMCRYLIANRANKRSIVEYHD